MPCFRPLSAYRGADGGVYFAGSKAKSGDGYGVAFSVPCGRCLGCRVMRSDSWTLRCLHELSVSGPSIFATFTYRDEALPEGRDLRYSDFQSFMKRLRAWSVRQTRLFHCAPAPVRFFCVGEYGDRFGRCHFHAILFNVAFCDAVPAGRGSRGDTLFSSEVLTNLWGHGLVQFGDVTRESINYCARYCHDLDDGNSGRRKYDFVEESTGEVFARRRPFARMSLNPGLGLPWFVRFFDDVVNNDFCLLDGRKVPVPRYYFEQLRFNPELRKMIKDSRSERIVSSPEFSADRLDVRERVLRAKFKLNPREVVK